MNVLRLLNPFRFANNYTINAVKKNVPSYAGSEIAASAKEMLKLLREVRHSAEEKGSKVNGMYNNARLSASKLVKSAEAGNSRKTSKNMNELHAQSKYLFNAIENPFTHDAIKAARKEQEYMTLVFGKHKQKV